MDGQGFWGLGMFGLAKFHRGVGVCSNDFMVVGMWRKMEVLIYDRVILVAHNSRLEGHYNVTRNRGRVLEAMYEAEYLVEK